MEHQDNLFEQFKKAAENSETKDFPGLEKVWSRVDAKLDTQVYTTQKNTNLTWKKFAVAASVIIGGVFTYQFLNEGKETPSNTKSVVVNDSIVSKIKEEPKDAVAYSDNENLVSEAEAKKIIEQQLNKPNAVAVKEVTAASLKADTMVLAKPMVASAEVREEKEALSQAKADDAVGVGYFSEAVSEAKKEARSNKQISKKAPPLIVADGKVVKDKNKSDLEDIESIVELKNPLYIINGVEYTEKEVFGPNPTSPYYPLNKQAIESVTIYQNEEATENYGDKGENGVVVIKTKNGKPLKNTR